MSQKLDHISVRLFPPPRSTAMLHSPGPLHYAPPEDPPIDYTLHAPKKRSIPEIPWKNNGIPLSKSASSPNNATKSYFPELPQEKSYWPKQTVSSRPTPFRPSTPQHSTRKLNGEDAAHRREKATGNKHLPSCPVDVVEFQYWLFGAQSLSHQGADTVAKISVHDQRDLSNWPKQTTSSKSTASAPLLRRRTTQLASAYKPRPEQTLSASTTTGKTSPLRQHSTSKVSVGVQKEDYDAAKLPNQLRDNAELSSDKSHQNGNHRSERTLSPKPAVRSATPVRGRSTRKLTGEVATHIQKESDTTTEPPSSNAATEISTDETQQEQDHRSEEKSSPKPTQRSTPPLQQLRKESDTASTPPPSDEASQESQQQEEDQRYGIKHTFAVLREADYVSIEEPSYRPEERPPIPELPPPPPPKPRRTTHKVDGEDIIQVRGRTDTTTTVRVAEHLLKDLDAVLDKEEFPPGSKERLEVIAENIHRQFEKKKPPHPPIPFKQTEESNGEQQEKQHSPKSTNSLTKNLPPPVAPDFSDDIMKELQSSKNKDSVAMNELRKTLVEKKYKEVEKSIEEAKRYYSPEYFTEIKSNAPGIPPWKRDLLAKRFSTEAIEQFEECVWRDFTEWKKRNAPGVEFNPPTKNLSSESYITY
ncbi:unnamed protein product [Cylicocyclus nassatus]|uniref:Uncharacterized protein n=1 Tax=Cylicocyclus nassatus TaxID=53992 RepID=A0AA36MBY0_CYLNA|nr:unnamed protein product [Cylicocyclus nassatus]